MFSADHSSSISVSCSGFPFPAPLCLRGGSSPSIEFNICQVARSFIPQLLVFSRFITPTVIPVVT